MSNVVPPWFPVALGELGTREVSGTGSNPQILRYLNAVHLGSEVGDETPWCSGFVAWCLAQAGNYCLGTASARSWLEAADKLDRPRLGAIAVLWRDSPIGFKGHAAFFCQEDAYSGLLLLGGNQRNGVCFATYDPKQVLGWRWPRQLLKSA